MRRLLCVTRCSFLICSGVLVRPYLIFSKTKGESSHSHNYTFSGNPSPAEGQDGGGCTASSFFDLRHGRASAPAGDYLRRWKKGRGTSVSPLQPQVGWKSRRMPACARRCAEAWGDSFALRSVHVQCERESFRRLGRLWKKSEGKNILWWMMCAVVHAVAARTSSETGFGKGFRFWAGRRYADRAAGTRDYRAEYP